MYVMSSIFNSSYLLCFRDPPAPSPAPEVWAPLWVARWADEEKLPLWINLSGCVAAGVGNGASEDDREDGAGWLGVKIMGFC